MDIEASADGHHSSDEDSEDDISSFICDSMIIGEDEIDNSAVDIQAKYLESLRSPSNRKMRGGFKIPQVIEFLLYCIFIIKTFYLIVSFAGEDVQKYIGYLFSNAP